MRCLVLHSVVVWNIVGEVSGGGISAKKKYGLWCFIRIYSETGWSSHSRSAVKAITSASAVVEICYFYFSRAIGSGYCEDCVPGVRCPAESQKFTPNVKYWLSFFISVTTQTHLILVSFSLSPFLCTFLSVKSMVSACYLLTWPRSSTLSRLIDYLAHFI